MNKRYLVASAFAAAISAPALIEAQKPVPTPTNFKAEKCYGIAKAGQNAWIYVPAGYCERIVGGSLKPKA